MKRRNEEKHMIPSRLLKPRYLHILNHMYIYIYNYICIYLFIYFIDLSIYRHIHIISHRFNERRSTIYFTPAVVK